MSDPSSALQDDRRYNYTSEKYPWLLFAGEYAHKATRPKDYDAIRVSINAKYGPGHYIIHYRWKGLFATRCVVPLCMAPRVRLFVLVESVSSAPSSRLCPCC